MPCAGVVSFSPQETPGGSAHPVGRGQRSANLLPCRGHTVRGRGSREAGLWPSTSGFQKKARSHLGAGGKGRVGEHPQALWDPKAPVSKLSRLLFSLWPSPTSGPPPEPQRPLLLGGPRHPPIPAPVGEPGLFLGAQCLAHVYPRPRRMIKCGYWPQRRSSLVKTVSQSRPQSRASCSEGMFYPGKKGQHPGARVTRELRASGHPGKGGTLPPASLSSRPPLHSWF